MLIPQPKPQTAKKVVDKYSDARAYSSLGCVFEKPQRIGWVPRHQILGALYADWRWPHVWPDGKGKRKFE